MELKDCKIGLLYFLKQDCGLHKRNSVVKCCGLIEGLKNKDGELRNCIIVKNEGRKTHSFIDCSIIEYALCHEAIETMRSLCKDANWGALTTAMKVLESDTAINKPYTDKLVKISKRIFYPSVAAHAMDLSKIQVFENKEGLQNNSSEIEQTEKKCSCSMQDLMREGCKCGGK